MPHQLRQGIEKSLEAYIETVVEDQLNKAGRILLPELRLFITQAFYAGAITVLSDVMDFSPLVLSTVDAIHLRKLADELNDFITKMKAEGN